MNSLRLSESSPAEGLPPAEFWIGPGPADYFDPDNKLITPTDDRGLIKIDELVEAVKAVIHPDYVWPAGRSVHHIYWRKQDYHEYAAYLEDPTPVAFRDLPPNKIHVPRNFENVLHRVTLQPVMPGLEVMHNYAQAWGIACSLFRSVSSAAEARELAKNRLSRPDITPEQLDTGQAIMDEILTRHFRGVSRHLGALTTIPHEYWPFDATLQAHEAATSIHTVATRRHRPYSYTVLSPAV